MLPPIRRMVPPASQSPRPVPCAPLVVTNGSKSSGTSAAGTPAPASSKVRTTARGVTRPRMRITPPSGIASLALRSRLRNMCERSADEPRRAGSAGTSTSMRIFALVADSSSLKSATELRSTAATSTVCDLSTPERTNSCRPCTVSVASARPSSIAAIVSAFSRPPSTARSEARRKATARSVLPRSCATAAAASPTISSRCWRMSACRTRASSPSRSSRSVASSTQISTAGGRRCRSNRTHSVRGPPFSVRRRARIAAPGRISSMARTIHAPSVIDPGLAPSQLSFSSSAKARLR